jgi:hypothetical protein
MAVYNPFDFFLEPGADNYPVPVRRSCWRRNWLPDLVPTPGRRPASRPVGHASTAASAAASISWWASTSACTRTISYLIRMEPGVQTPEQTLTLGSRLLPRLGLAAGAAAAATAGWRRVSCRAT